MPTISKVTANGLRYGWMFHLSTIDDVFEYLEHVQTPRSRAEFMEAIKYVRGQAHANPVAYLAELKGISLTNAQIQLNTDRIDGMLKVLRESCDIFVNHNGGYFGRLPDTKIVESRVIDVWALPDEQPRFFQWQNGTHWYAKIGEEDIVVNGQQKWDTRHEAEKAAKLYLEGKTR